MPNNKPIKILSTRLLREDIIHKAALKNITIDAAAFISTHTIESEAIAVKIKEVAQQNVVAVFTSMNAVEAVMPQLDALPNWQLFCMGGITKEKLLHFFNENQLLASAKNALALAEKIIHQGNIANVVFFCGDQRFDELPETLKANGIGVEEIVVYETTQTPIEIQDNYDSVVFFSPSAVHSFFSENTIPVTIPVFSIGKTTTATIRTYVTNEIITSEWPGQEQMIDQAISYFASVKEKV